VWLDTFEVSYHKSKQYEVLHTDRPFIAHFRYATIGMVNKSNTHPFLCGNNTDELLMMNGTIRGLGNEKMCDSKVLAISLGRVKRQNWKQELSKYDCRFTTINTRTRTFQIYNKELWTKKNGVWYSKSNVLMDNLVAVYGTLKRGYNNYNNYLRRSVYLGSGNTQDKYPLIIEGLPYMVNQKGLGHNVEVDVFKVGDEVLKNLDTLEGHPRWYRREEIPVKLASGKVLKCWTYFNPKTIGSNTTLHKTYTQSYTLNNWATGYSKNKSNDTQVKSYSPQTFDWSQSSFDFEDDEIDTFREDEILRDNEELNTKPFCVNCYHDLEFDGFSNYHCSGCDNWFTEHEVLTDSI
jgi:gamma-glutamylaminecyclotransferase